ncbi:MULTISPECIES: cob(I)yrinic acid a,c-diamide adenosyltransferase [Segatella]|jgi:ATP:cob(I)alamin adenosyltransferase|uniref:Corrinoid adenosyltransferase n=2 Tax=Segatella TaxID=2974251 RepID=D8DZF8_9BACT|nr:MULTISPECIES: cob(I)yrinic acid a,c-diamide adenosyltransferase [Segatella]MBQ3857224.1 cob(I)yrinic acid a,c-diamide adenosyltransferase [Prevotella sp.]EFI71228.1 ATP:cob(I)alamin adenosyltransferase [Segatella baroniae B14]MDR4929914.1 cob(I)yrinic acid a,c-diamide adenosyltransferase [Segatella bryantii]MEE3413956.1 cob(I)yrinic acid a,c-diamide adenosyltransferase [Prevotella sp.]UKK75575.1 cob(I)yrinic acid a,c-diamide adenosyltransferase [Segatella bryantii]
MKIYTKTGDQGQTSLTQGLRVDKDDVRIEANGELDELNAIIGIVKSLMQDDYIHVKKLDRIQQCLMYVMSCVASDERMRQKKDVDMLIEVNSGMEKEIDLIAGEKNFGFVLPGQNRLSAFVHLARAKTRTGERRLWTVNRLYPVMPEIMQFMNRLSDYFYALSLL